MLDAPQLAKAANYNDRKDGALWHQVNLPWPLTEYAPDSTTFATLVGFFQSTHGLTVDGYLGPNTLSTIRALQQKPSAEPAGTTTRRKDPEPVKPEVTPRLGPSNAVVISGVSVKLPQAMIDAGVTCTNYKDDDEHHFSCYNRTKPTHHVVIHESVTNSASSTVNVLRRRKTKGGKTLGVHLMIAPDGHIVCHNDLVKEVTIHGNQLNRTSIGLEIVNPYSPKYAKPPFTNVIAKKWWTWIPKGAPKQYTTPTDAQLTSVKLLIPWLCEQIDTLPYEFPTKDLNARKRKIANWKSGGKPAPGIVCHRDYASHADGRYVLEELIPA